MNQWSPRSVRETTCKLFAFLGWLPEFPFSRSALVERGVTDPLGETLGNTADTKSFDKAFPVRLLLLAKSKRKGFKPNSVCGTISIPGNPKSDSVREWRRTGDCDNSSLLRFAHAVNGGDLARIDRGHADHLGQVCEVSREDRPLSEQ